MNTPWDYDRPPWWHFRARREWREASGRRLQAWAWEVTDHGRHPIHLGTFRAIARGDQ